jgi:hypothetical protein
MKKYRASWLKRHDCILFLGFVTFFGSLLMLDRQSDVQLHMRFLQEILRGERAFPPNFVYYFLVLILSFFQNNLQLFYISSTVILATAVTAKFILTKKFISNKIEHTKNTDTSKTVAILLSICLLFSFSIPWPQFNWYLGQIPPNVWHNPTTILLMPFAIGLYILSIEQLKQANNQRIKWIYFLVLLNVFIKPSFFFVYSVAYPFFLFCKFRFGPSFWKNVLPVFAGFAGMFLVYHFVYETQSGVKIVIHPLYVWRLYSHNIVGSLALSLAFPLVYILLYWPSLFKDRAFQFALTLFLGGILIFSLFSEMGRESEGNFFWQCVVTMYILLMTLIADLANKLCTQKIDWKIVLACALLVTHAIAGCIYLMRFYIIGAYF